MADDPEPSSTPLGFVDSRKPPPPVTRRVMQIEDGAVVSFAIIGRATEIDTDAVGAALDLSLARAIYARQRWKLGLIWIGLAAVIILLVVILYFII